MSNYKPPEDPLAFAFTSFGATLKIESNDQELFDLAMSEASRALIDKLEFIDADTAVPDRTYGLFLDGQTYRLFENGEESTFGESKANFINFFNAILRVAVGEHAHSLVFLHAGVVGWRGKAIVIPANSFSGKTTLVAELVKCGAEYYSDEYAIIDSNGLVHPFARDLSIRLDGDRARDTLVSIELIGGTAGTEPLPVGMLLLTRYEADGSFQPNVLTHGNGILETVPFAIPVLNDPERTIKQLTTAFKDSVIIKTTRGEAAETARDVLSYFDSTVE